MPDRSNAPHDALFRKFFSYPETARDFLDSAFRSYDMNNSRSAATANLR
jgi:predicted transposase YdaD